MSPLFSYPYLHPSFSLPSLPHLSSSNSPAHRHLTLPQKTQNSGASLCPLIEETSAPLDTTSPNSESHGHLSLGQPSRKIISPQERNTTKKCSLCNGSIPDRIEPYTLRQGAPAALAALNPHVPSSATPKIFCYTCWVWIHNLSICWSCGETVSRREERVSYGWCWWHWGCVCCLLCRTPIRPPPWTNNPRGTPLQITPICRYCAEDTTVPEGAGPSISLQKISSPLPKPSSRPLPKRMANLPPNRVLKRGPSVLAPTLTHPASSPSPPLSIDSSFSSCLGSHTRPAAPRATSSTSQNKAPGDKASATATRTRALKPTYGAKAPPYIRELSELFSATGRRKRRRNGRGFCGCESSEETCGLICGDFGGIGVMEDGRNFGVEMMEEEGKEKKLGWVV